MHVHTNFKLAQRQALVHLHYINLTRGIQTHPTVSRIDAQTRTALIRGHGQGTGISHPENFSPPIWPLSQFNMPGHCDLMYADANPTQYTLQKGVSKAVPSDQSHPSTHVGVTPNVSITSAVSSPNFEQGASRNRSHKSKKMRKKRAEESSLSSRQHAGMHEALKRPYICQTCGKRYAQPGGVMRHYRAMHDPSSCTYCGARWSRPYQYRDHLEKHHRDVDPDLVLGKPPGSRRRAKVIGLGRGRPQLPLPAAVKVPQVPPGFSSAEELGQPVNSNVVDHSSGLPRALPGGFTTTNCSSSPVMAHIPFPCPPFGGYYGDLVSVDPVFEPSGFIHPYH